MPKKKSLKSTKGTLHEDIYTFIIFHWYVVAQLVQALHYKPDGLCFNSRWGHLLNPDPGFDTASKRNEQKGYLLAVKVADV